MIKRLFTLSDRGDNLPLSNSMVWRYNELLAQLSENYKDLEFVEFCHMLRQGTIIFCIGEFEGDDDPAIITAAATLCPIYKATGFIGEIHDVVVDREYRRQGLGRRVVEEALNEARRLKMRHIDLSSQPKREAANLMYLEMGFAIRGTNAYRFKLIA